MRELWQDVRYGCRMLVIHPGSTLVVTITLALVISAVTLALGVYQQTRSEWMPFADSDRLIRLWRVGTGRPSDRLAASIYAGAVGSLRGLESIAAIEGYQPFVMTGADEPVSLTGACVSAGVFDVLGVSPALGRAFAAEETRRGSTPTVMLSHRLWQETFAGDPSALGKSLCLNGTSYVVIGVMPPGFDRSVLFYGADLWLLADFESPAQSATRVQVVARRRSKCSLPELQAELDAVLTPVLRADRAQDGSAASLQRVTALPIGKQFGGIRAGEVVFAVAVPASIILIACLNVMNILLGQMVSRRREIAVRFSLGAGRGRLIRQLVTESMLLAGCGGGLGIVAATWVSGWAATRGLETQFSPLVFVAACIVTFFIGLAVGWLPAWRAASARLSADLKDGGVASGGIGRHRLRNLLATSQLAVAVALCITAGLLVRSYLNKRQFRPGFDTSNLTEIGISPRADVYGRPEGRLLYGEQVRERLRALPAVAQVAIGSTSCVERTPFPMSFRMETEEGLSRPDQIVRLTVVSPDYLNMVNLPVLRGRALTDADRRGSEPVLLVNEFFVNAFLAGADPVGRRIELPAEEQAAWFTVVGVVPDRRSMGRDENLGPEAYLSSLQIAAPWVSYTFLIRTRTHAGAPQQALRKAVRSVGSDQPISGIETVEAKLQRAVRRDLAGTQAMSLIALFGLIMAVLGVYGVVSNSVVERTHEIGIRMALGGRRADVLILILRGGLTLTTMGLTAGGVLAAATTFGISQLLFGIRPLDSICYLTVCTILAGTVLVASLVPARRAMRIDPMTALRCE